MSNLTIPKLFKEIRNILEQRSKLNIGFIGESGSGKSTLINSLRGIYPHEKGAAETDIYECTKEPKAYNYPNFENIILWDLPGVNTPKFPLETYLANIDLSKDALYAMEKYYFFF